MDAPTIARLLAGVLDGDLSAIATLSRYSHTEIERVARRLPPLILTRAGLRNVCSAFQRKEAPADLVNTWAWFVRSGYIPGGSGPIQPIEIAYDPNWEECIADIVSRLTELGDMIDGVIDDAELAEMLHNLSE